MIRIATKEESRENYHKSVLRTESLEGLNTIPGELYLDCTLGGGGHTQAILDAGGKVIALDVDEDAIGHAKQKFGLKERDGVWVTNDLNLVVKRLNFKELGQLKENGFSGILFDLGVSSFMLDRAEKGFSFSKEGPLDMRMDSTLAVEAKDLLNGLNEGELYELFSKLGEERYARRIARDVVRHRLESPFVTTKDLSELINSSIKTKGKEINPSTRVFMALRIAVNDELNNLREALRSCIGVLKPGGRLVVISFHSLEDRIVKEFFKNQQNLKILTPKPLVPSVEEQRSNPRSRSAKMRVAEKV